MGNGKQLLPFISIYYIIITYDILYYFLVINLGKLWE